MAVETYSYPSPGVHAFLRSCAELAGKRRFNAAPKSREVAKLLTEYRQRWSVTLQRAQANALRDKTHEAIAADELGLQGPFEPLGEEQLYQLIEDPTGHCKLATPSAAPAKFHIRHILSVGSLPARLGRGAVGTPRGGNAATRPGAWPFEFRGAGNPGARRRPRNGPLAAAAGRYSRNVGGRNGAASTATAPAGGSVPRSPGRDYLRCARNYSAAHDVRQSQPTEDGAGKAPCDATPSVPHEPRGPDVEVTDAATADEGNAAAETACPATCEESGSGGRGAEDPADIPPTSAATRAAQGRETQGTRVEIPDAAETDPAPVELARHSTRRQGEHGIAQETRDDPPRAAEETTRAQDGARAPTQQDEPALGDAEAQARGLEGESNRGRNHI
ncbi:unnamed protein product [Closterium sp. Naga37s-1]|nr:unnamed protein product [Closterium sp. Naga37s-1]